MGCSRTYAVERCAVTGFASRVFEHRATWYVVVVMLLLVNIALWIGGVFWIFGRHRFEGPVLFLFAPGAGVHLSDPLGIIVPFAVSYGSFRWLR